VTVNATVATFTKDTLLDECVDISLTMPPGSAADKGQEVIDKMVTTMVTDKKDKARSKSRLNKPCAAQFRNNPVLATCAVRTPIPIPPKVDGGTPAGAVDLQITSGYYSLDMIEKSDTYMKNCIDMKGDWQTVDHDSEAWRDAHMARARREVEKLQKTLGQ
jgi:hypothetical protein